MINNIKLLGMFRRESHDTKIGRNLLIFTVISGIANVLLLVIINAVAHSANYGNLNFRFLILFVVSITIFIISQRYILSRVVIMAEDIINNVRNRIIKKVRKCDYLKLERIGHSDIYTKITKDSLIITQNAPLIMNAIQCVLMVVFSLVYIGYLSLTAFWLTILSIGGSVIYYLINDKKISADMRSAAQKEIELFDAMTHILQGFKEIKVNHRKGNAVSRFVEGISEAVKKLKIKALIPYADNYVYSVVFIYLLIAIIIFILPNLYTNFGDVVIKLTTAVLFIVGPISNVVNMVSLVAQSNISVENIYKLETILDEANDGLNYEGVTEIPPISFEHEIELKGICFDYRDNEGNSLFTLGPVDLSLKHNEIVYIIGGNGSGKSTFLKLLTALYHPDLGKLSVDGTSLIKENLQPYRELYSVIFSDFHLFDRLYGIEDVNIEKLTELLKLMEINEKTAYINDRFTNLNLSTGQRKRLALAVTYMENRDIYVFDEWAADQDPHFRTYFYEELIPDLKKQGKTIIAVTHDDRYFHTADRVLKMEYGKISTLIDNRVRGDL